MHSMDLVGGELVQIFKQVLGGSLERAVERPRTRTRRGR